MFELLFIIRGVCLFTLVAGMCFFPGAPLQLTCGTIFFFSIYYNHFCQSYLLTIQMSTMQIIFERILGAKITYSGDKLDYGDSAIILSNHQSSCDIFMIGGLGWHLGMSGFSRYFMKDSIKYIPIFGWGLWLSGQLFVKRRWESDQKAIDKLYNKIVYNKLPVWIVSFPEGTRINKEKKEESQAFSKARDLPILEHVLLPRTKGVVTSIEKLRNSHIKYIYNITIAYEKNQIGGFGKAAGALEAYFMGKVSPLYRHHIHIEKVAIENLPTDSMKLSNWVISSFKKKDAFLENIKSRGWSKALNACSNLRMKP